MPRYEENTLRRPSCFGDVREHDETDRICRNCRWLQTCAVIVKNKKRDARDRDVRDDRDDRRNDRSDSRRGPGRSIPVNPDPEDYLEREDESLGYFGALMFNGALAGVRAGLVESVFALDQIPRAPYTDPFKSIMAPPKRKAAKRDERDERDEEE